MDLLDYFGLDCSDDTRGSQLPIGTERFGWALNCVTFTQLALGIVDVARRHASDGSNLAVRPVGLGQ